MAKILLIFILRLIQSALSQKAETEPAGNRRGCSQGGSVMGRRDVASLPSRSGLHLGRVRGRASPFRAKSVFSASSRRILNATYAVTGVSTAPVLRVIMSSTRKAHLTDEVLRRPVPSGRVIVGYKPNAKGQHHALVTGTDSSRPRLQGWQQRRSRSFTTESQNRGKLIWYLRMPSGQVSWRDCGHQMACPCLLRATPSTAKNGPYARWILDGRFMKPEEPCRIAPQERSGWVRFQVPLVNTRWRGGWQSSGSALIGYPPAFGRSRGQPTGSGITVGRTQVSCHYRALRGVAGGFPERSYWSRSRPAKSGPCGVHGSPTLGQAPSGSPGD